jgi:hypothetical protein
MKRLSYYRELIGIDSIWIINVSHILKQQVYSEENCRCGNHMVGMDIDWERNIATINHTKKLKEDDIIHELLHIKYPEVTEDYINREVEKYKISSKKGS